MATQRITFCSFKPNSGFNTNTMSENILQQNTEEKYCVLSEQGAVFIRGCYYIEKQQSDSRFNFQTGEFETVKFTKQFSLKFEIDLQSNTIMIWGSKNLVPDLLTDIAIASDNKVVIEEINVDFRNTLSKVLKSSTVKVSKMKIQNIPIEKGVFATCSIDVNTLETPNAFVQKYIDNITQVSLLLNNDYLSESETTSISATLFASGSLIVYKDKDSISDEVIDTIKNLVI